MASEFDNTLFDPTVFEGERNRWVLLLAKTIAIAPHIKFGEVPGPIAHGIYLLYMRGRLIYIGKSSGDSVSTGNSIFGRLEAHWVKVQNRVGLFPELMTYQVIPIDAEYSGTILQIEQYAIQTYKPYLNRTGFGSANPGHGRRFQGESKFEKMHPLKTGRKGIYSPPEQVSFIRRTTVEVECYA